MSSSTLQLSNNPRLIVRTYAWIGWWCPVCRCVMSCAGCCLRGVSRNCCHCSCCVRDECCFANYRFHCSRATNQIGRCFLGRAVSTVGCCFPGQFCPVRDGCLNCGCHCCRGADYLHGGCLRDCRCRADWHQDAGWVCRSCQAGWRVHQGGGHGRAGRKAGCRGPAASCGNGRAYPGHG